MDKETFYLFGEILSRVLPFRVMDAALKILAVPIGRARGTLQAVEENLKYVLDSESTAGADRIRELSKEVLKNFSSSLCDLAYSRRLSDAFIKKSVEIRGFEFLEEALSLKRKGAVLAGVHLGHWELGGTVLARKGYPVTAIALKHKNPILQAAFQKRRDLNGLKIIPTGQSLKNCYTCLKENRVLAVMGDRLFAGQGIEVNFFGKKVAYPKGPARFALQAGAPILPVFCVATHACPRKYLLEIWPPLEGLTEKDLTQAFAKKVEEMVKRYPEQWFVFQRFWEPVL